MANPAQPITHDNGAQETSFNTLKCSLCEESFIVSNETANATGSEILCPSCSQIVKTVGMDKILAIVTHADVGDDHEDLNLNDEEEFVADVDLEDRDDDEDLDALDDLDDVEDLEDLEDLNDEEDDNEEDDDDDDYDDEEEDADEEEDKY